jgi:hypothetical protein
LSGPESLRGSGPLTTRSQREDSGKEQTVAASAAPEPDDGSYAEQFDEHRLQLAAEQPLISDDTVRKARQAWEQAFGPIEVDEHGEPVQPDSLFDWGL